MSKEPTNYDRIAEALKKTYAELSEQDVKLVLQSRGGYYNPDPTTFGVDAQAVRVALGSPGLIMGLAKHLFGEVEE